MVCRSAVFGIAPLIYSVRQFIRGVDVDPVDNTDSIFEFICFFTVATFT